MDQHPVPQNVTTFQFRLIGDMTIKQFGFLAGGAILAYISYKLPLPFFFSWPLALIFGLGGFGFAFVPVEERPMDVWVLSFLRSIYNPTQYVWQKTPPQTVPPAPIVKPATPPALQSVAMPVQTAPPQTHAPQGKTPAEILSGVFGTQKATPTQPQQTPHRPQPSMVDWITQLFSFQPHKPPERLVSAAAHVKTPSVTGKHLDISTPPTVTATPKAQEAALHDVQQKEEALEGKMQNLKKELANKTMTEARVLELQKQLAEVLAQRDKMETEVIALRKQAATPITSPPHAQPVQAPLGASHIATPSTSTGPTVKIITPEGAVKAGLPRLTTFPNVVTGITKDSDNNFLPGVLITVKDKDGVPLRALKTNRLGQFAASTPLANNVYFVEIEDPRGRYTFDRVQITLNGSIVPAIEIIAKSQKEITRAQLAKELFGNTIP